MTIGDYKIRLQKRLTLSGWQAAMISILAIVVALALFSVIFILAGVNPFLAYREIFSYAFFNPFGLPLTMNRFVFLLLCTYAFIIPYRAGLWNIGMTGQLYAGSLAVYGVLLALGADKSATVLPPPIIVLPLLLLAAAAGGAALGAVAGFLKGKYDINEIVVTMMLNFMMFWLVSFMIKEGGPFMNPGGRGRASSCPTPCRRP